jgi:hypothetical protein
VRGVLDIDQKQVHSVKMIVTKVLTAWLRTARHDRLASLDISFLEDPHATVYLLSPAGGTVAPQAHHPDRSADRPPARKVWCRHQISGDIADRRSTAAGVHADVSCPSWLRPTARHGGSGRAVSLTAPDGESFAGRLPGPPDGRFRQQKTSTPLY